MCIMLTKPASERLDKQAIRNCFDGNGDGAGFAWASGGLLNIQKRPQWDFEELWNALVEREHLPMLIHFRLSTHGGLTTANTHPFHLVTGDPKIQLAMAHNGIFKVKPSGDDSDTVAVIKSFIQPALMKNPNIVTTKKFRNAIKPYAGWSRIAWMDNYGTFYYYGHEEGETWNGCWWSNSGYKDRYCKVTKDHETLVDLHETMRVRAEWYETQRTKLGQGLYILREKDMECYVCDCPVDPKDGFIIAKGTLNVCCADCWKDFQGEDINKEAEEEPSVDAEADVALAADADVFPPDASDGVSKIPELTLLPSEPLPAEDEYAVLPGMVVPQKKPQQDLIVTN